MNRPDIHTLRTDTGIGEVSEDLTELISGLRLDADNTTCTSERWDLVLRSRDAVFQNAVGQRLQSWQIVQMQNRSELGDDVWSRSKGFGGATTY
jgi:hypothetical protein